ncbi:carbon monoxide dehydrogenase subunit G [Halosimplex carlsbadense 2-9-1]|uniref:Carbon monoxide dehydrogenase subunit G n=1 Tax=Halosimplex carlsbadense 2-9-1 TaxID=797114 RepID=M0C9K2_9EURY|nr:carbon monoxide dehydrogenase subunit G [Halosimplex carlsbadense]ELZ19956.1 carbon monoxide dehydrogenase subunit G [Halosimplex carlsbadense 2-9-1]
MEFSGEFTVDGTPEELWKYFTDPDILMDCAPGCNELVLEGPSRIVAGLTVGVGSVKPSFDVEGIVTAADRPNELEIEATGEASRNSFKATASQELHDNGDGTTTVSWQASAEVSGIIASLGERAIGSVADKLVTQFFRDLEGHVNEGTPAESKLRAASSEELEATEQREADSIGSGGDLTATAVSKVAEATGADGPSRGQSFVAGVVLGVVGSAVVRRLRSGGQREVVAREARDPSPASQGTASDPRTGSSGDGTSSLLVLGLTAALGAAGAIIWGRSRRDGTGGPVDTAVPDSGDETTTADESTDDRSLGDATGTEPATNGDVGSDNPLDRLESRP